MGDWKEIQVAGHLCDVFEPSQPNKHHFAVVYLHGVHLTRLVENDTFTQLFEQLGLPVIGPMTGRSWWTDRICQEFDKNLTAERHVMDNVLAFLQQQWQASPPRIALLGTSMGGQGALRFALKYPDTFPIVAALAPAIDYQLRWGSGDETLAGMYDNAESIRQDTATLHIHPLAWPRNIWFCCDPKDSVWHESSERLRMKLSALGIPHQCDLETEGGGHGFGYYNRMAAAAMQFIAESLERERLRIH